MEKIWHAECMAEWLNESGSRQKDIAFLCLESRRETRTEE